MRTHLFTPSFLRVPALHIVAVSLVTWVCTSGCSNSDESPAPAGSSGNAGASGAGGTAGNSGSAGSGGSAGTGGAAGTNGASGAGGVGGGGSGGSSGTGGTAGAGGTAGTGGTGGSAGAPIDCDPIAQNCGDPSLRCFPVKGLLNGAESYVNSCIANGTKLEGETCSQDKATGTDDCAAGLYCWIQSGGSTPQTTCTPLCEQSSDCANGRVCVFDKAPTVGHKNGVCLDGCTLFDGSCASGTYCRSKSILNTVDTLTASGACTGVGPGDAHAPCFTGQDCMTGLICNASLTCAAICDSTHTCGGGVSCYTAQGAQSGACLSADWSCFPNPSPPLATESTALFTLSFIDGLSGKSIVGVEVTACAENDEACSSPLSSGTTDDAGVVELSIPVTAGGFAGYFLGKTTGYLDKITFPNVYPDFRGNFYLNSAMFTTASLNTLAGISGAGTLDATRGTVYFNVADCSFQYNSGLGVQIGVDSADASSKVRYFAATLSSSLTKTGAAGRSSGVVFNVPPSSGTLDTVTATDPQTMTTVGHRNIWVRPNTVTFVAVHP